MSETAELDAEVAEYLTGAAPTTETYRIRLAPGDVEGLRTVARLESVMQGKDLSWADLLRQAAASIVKNRRPVA